MKLHEVESTAGSRKARRRVGRGDGSGWGGTCARGEKGQKSRKGSTIRHHFEGGQTPSFRRIPKRGFASGVKLVFNVVNIADIEACFEADAVIETAILREMGLIGKACAPLKVLGDGEVTKAFTIRAEKFSASAKAKIEAAGGKCEEIA